MLVNAALTQLPPNKFPYQRQALRQLCATVVPLLPALSLLWLSMSGIPVCPLADRFCLVISLTHIVPYCWEARQITMFWFKIQM